MRTRTHTHFMDLCLSSLFTTLCTYTDPKTRAPATLTRIMNKMAFDVGEFRHRPVEPFYLLHSSQSSDCQPVLWATEGIQECILVSEAFRLLHTYNFVQFIRSGNCSMFCFGHKIVPPKTYKNTWLVGSSLTMARRALLSSSVVRCRYTEDFWLFFRSFCLFVVIGVLLWCQCACHCVCFCWGGGNIFAHHRRRWKLKRWHFKRKIHHQLAAGCMHITHSDCRNSNDNPNSCAKHWRKLSTPWPRHRSIASQRLCAHSNFRSIRYQFFFLRLVRVRFLQCCRQAISG